MEGDIGPTSAIQRYCVPCLLTEHFLRSLQSRNTEILVALARYASRGNVSRIRRRWWRVSHSVAFDTSIENPIRATRLSTESGRYCRAAADVSQPAGVLDILAAIAFSSSEILGFLSSRVWGLQPTLIARRLVILDDRVPRYMDTKRDGENFSRISDCTMEGAES